MNVSPGALHLIALAAVVCLFAWWLLHLKSGWRGFCLAVVGSLLILGAGDWPVVVLLLARMRDVVLPGLFVLFLLAAVIGLFLMQARLHLDEQELSLPLAEEQCSHCHQRGFLHSYEVQHGRHSRIQRLCSDCAGKKDGKFVSA
jgi:hypothetical protein